MAELNGNEFNFIASQLKLRKRGRLLSQKFLLGLYPKINIRKYSFISNTSGIHHVEDFFCGRSGQNAPAGRIPMKTRESPSCLSAHSA